MFGWRKRDDGFEWQTYVRTTIKLRREARKQKAQALGEQVAEGARAAGAVADELARKGAEGLGNAARAAAGQAGIASVSAMSLAGQGLGAATAGLRRVLTPVADLLGRPGVAGPLAFVGLLATAAGIARALLGAKGLDGEAITALGLGIACMALGLGPALWLGHEVLPKRISAPITGLPPKPWLIGGAAAIVALIGAIGVASWQGGSGLQLARMPSLGLVASSAISGKASVVAADVVKIGAERVQLTGLEAPHPDQRCTRPGTRAGGRKWFCGLEAREALTRLVQGQTVTCDVSPKAGDGPMRGRCRVNGADVAEALVRAGHAFAEPGFISSYRAAEDEAKAAKAGMWGGTEPERPAAWREKIWLAAKRQAPDGCPIKGRIRGDERVYLMPWVSEYDRVRVSKRRGERWFCSEEEALAAGWRSVSGG